MKKVIVVLAALVLVSGKAWSSEPEWQEVSRGIVNVRSVLVSPDNPKVIYAGADKGVFRTEDAGNTWRNILSVRGDSRAVNYLIFDAQNKNALYAATGNGLYFSENAGQRWNRIFKGKNSFENECVFVTIIPQGMYLGTKSGLFVSKDRGRSWYKEAGKLGASRIFNISVVYKEPEQLYVSCSDGVFKTVDSGMTWERIFIAHPVENGLEQEEETEDRDEDERHSEIRYVAIDPQSPDNLYLATSRGVYKSKNRGAGWELLSEYGLLSRDTQFLLFSDKSSGFYAMSKSGVFMYKDDAWRELSFNLASGSINFLLLDKDMNLYACSDKGLFKTSLSYTSSFEVPDIISGYSNGEPGIEEVQKQAIKYAEVEPSKIINWRKQAQKKAIFPKVSMGLERNTGDLWHWEGGSTTKDCDDTLRRGRDTLDWDVTLSWDLSELVWNSDQTSIDTRSRLMVQLRDDILDEVNKTYFERIRVKMEMDSLQIEDRKKRFEKELRVRELTASLDALTGGYFSSHTR
ncbi:MAG: hypothetical protein NTW18_01180 [Candidatus Omnitrophica bacterium]|nr:hypothetical protein [Candidatus Omnitrophota bacterium]